MIAVFVVIRVENILFCPTTKTISVHTFSDCLAGQRQAVIRNYLASNEIGVRRRWPGSEYIVDWDCVDMVVEVMLQSGDLMPVNLYVLSAEASLPVGAYRDQFYRR